MKDHKKTQRQLEIMSFIAMHPKGVTIRELVEAFAVSERTIRRYLAELKDSWLDFLSMTAANPDKALGWVLKYYKECPEARDLPEFRQNGEVLRMF